MKRKPLGRSGLYVSELCLGTMTFGGAGFWKVVGTLGQTSANSIAVGPHGPLGAPDPRTRGAWAEGQ